MSFCNHFNFGTYKHTGIIYSSNHSIAKLTLNMRRNFWQPKTSPAPCPIAAILGLNAGWQTDFIARTPGCVRNDSETHETVLLDCTTGERNWDGACLMNLTQQIFFFQINNLVHCFDESWWNMPFKRTRHGDALSHVIIAMLKRLFSIMTSHGLN